VVVVEPRQKEVLVFHAKEKESEMTSINDGLLYIMNSLFPEEIEQPSNDYVDLFDDYLTDESDNANSNQ